VQREPPVDAPWHRDARGIARRQHPLVSTCTQPVSIGARSRPARRVERMRPFVAAAVNESQQIAAEPVLVLVGDG